MTPYELWHKRRSNLSYLKTWGCLSYVKIPYMKRSKLGPKTYKCVVISYCENSKTYIFLNLVTNKIIKFRNAEFFEHINNKNDIKSQKIVNSEHNNSHDDTNTHENKHIESTANKRFCMMI